MGNQGLDGSMACLPEGPNELVADRLELRAVFFSHHLPVGAGETSGSERGRAISTEEGRRSWWKILGGRCGKMSPFRQEEGQVTFATSVARGTGTRVE